MMDARLEKLADVLVNHSCKAQQGENVLIEAHGIDDALVRALVKKTREAGANPFVNLRDAKVTRALLMDATEEQIGAWADCDLEQMKRMNCYIGVRGGANINEMSDVPSEKMALYNKRYLTPVHFEQRVKNTKWVILRYPTASMAQLAGMSTESFEKFFFDVCTMDYERMEKAMQALKELMDKTDKVRLTGKGTDLSFSIKGIPSVVCAGRHNIPDGEVFTAPVKDSVNGVIAFNAPSPYEGHTFENVALAYKNGKIVSATAKNAEKLNKILDTDEGSRYVGEFAVAVNPFIREPMKDILFDEKIDGSFHFTPGQAYEDADNGNRSAVHWDMVFVQRPEYGGGEMWFDGRLVRKNGRFVVPELECLNPENLR